MKTPEKVVKEDDGIFQIKIDKDIYTVDEGYYRRVRRLRQSSNNMLQVIKAYTKRIEVKKKYLDETYNDIKKKCKKQIRR